MRRGTRTFGRVRDFIILVAFLVLALPLSMAGEYSENWDSLGQGGDGMQSFTFGPLIAEDEPYVGSRCQYTPYEFHSPGRCRPWGGSDWHVHLPFNSPSPKSHSGDGSLHMGVHRGDSDFGDSYTTAQLSAAMTPPIRLMPSGSRRDEGPAGPGDKARRRELSFWHIASLADNCDLAMPGTEVTADRAVVQVAEADPETGQVISNWVTIEGQHNGYTRDVTTFFFNCQFDPMDDGSTETDLGPGQDTRETPEGKFRLLTGPSSTCFPQKAFSRMGDWVFSDPSATGDAESGSGESGNMGPGTWVESRFNLAAYSGKTIRIRLLISGLDMDSPGRAWSDLLFFLGLDLDCFRGWIIDDFRVTGVAEVLPNPAP